MANLLNMSGGSLLKKGLPYDAEIEYLESSRTQYIDTGIIPYRGLEATIDFQYTSLADNQSLFGSWATNPYIVYQVALYTNRWFFGSYSYAESNVAWLNGAIDAKRHIISIDGNSSISQDNVILLTPGYISNNTSNSAIYIFGRSVNGSIQTATMSSIRCYSFKLAENNTLVFDAIPVRVGQTGYMYDKVSGQLFGNQGTGSFILGNDI